MQKGQKKVSDEPTLVTFDFRQMNGLGHLSLVFGMYSV